MAVGRGAAQEPGWRSGGDCSVFACAGNSCFTLGFNLVLRGAEEQERACAWANQARKQTCLNMVKFSGPSQSIFWGVRALPVPARAVQAAFSRAAPVGAGELRC